MKCDVIIPVYNSPEWVKLCVYALMKNTDDKILDTVYLINDCSNDVTTNLLNNKKLALQLMEDIGLEKYPEGYNKGEWIVYDFDNIVIHSFVPTTRAKYNMDRLWLSKKIDDKILKGEE